jgi:putative addiction module component (TIGR02574 family)
MSKSEIISELPKLSPAEREEVRAKLDELDGARWLDGEELTEDERRLLETRLQEYQTDPDSGSSWEEVQARILSRLKK